MDLSLEQLEEALAIRRQIEHLQTRLDHVLGGSNSATKAVAKRSVTSDAPGSGGRTGKRRGKLSAAGRERIAAAARARWARKKAADKEGRAANDSLNTTPKTSAAKSSDKPRAGGSRGLSSAGRKKLSQMMKARWAARRKAEGR